MLRKCLFQHFSRPFVAEPPSLRRGFWPSRPKEPKTPKKGVFSALFGLRSGHSGRLWLSHGGPLDGPKKSGISGLFRPCPLDAALQGLSGLADTKKTSKRPKNSCFSVFLTLFEAFSGLGRWACGVFRKRRCFSSEKHLLFFRRRASSFLIGAGQKARKRPKTGLFRPFSDPFWRGAVRCNTPAVPSMDGTA